MVDATQIEQSLGSLGQRLAEGRESEWVSDPELWRRLMAPVSAYLKLLGKWQGSQRLVGWPKPTEWLNKGVIPAMAGAALLREGECWVDVGSGAGLPGVMVAMLGQAGAPLGLGRLIEKRRKRVAFLQACVRELDLDLEVVQGTYGRDGLVARGPEILLARALAPPQEVLTLASLAGNSSALLWLSEEAGQSLSRAELGQNSAFVPKAALPSSTCGTGMVLRLDEDRRGESSPLPT